MNALLRSAHVLAVAVWLGSVVFFTLTGLLLFRSFAEVSGESAEDRPAWLPLPPIYARPSPGPGFPDPLRLEQGSRAAGVALRQVFPAYFALQAGCGVVALLTALFLARSAEGGAHGRRVAVALLALITVLGGWWLEGEVARLRGPRDQLTDEVLAIRLPAPDKLEEARRARATFGAWHGYSLGQNLATLILVAGLTLLVPPLCRGTQPG